MSFLATRAVAQLSLVARAHLVAYRPHEGDAGGDGREARQDERPAPAEILRHYAGDQRRQRDAEIAPHAVDADLAADLLRVGDDHRRADRMIDRGEDADRKQRDTQLQRRLHEADADHAEADADEVDRHHVAAAPAVAEPAAQERARTEGDKARRRIGQHLRIAKAERRRHQDHGRGENQHRVVVDEMREVDVGDDGLRAVHGLKVRHCKSMVKV